MAGTRLLVPPSYPQNNKTMKVAVWDTHVTRNDGVIMNFDIIVPETMTDEDTIYGYGRAYLKARKMPDYVLTSNQCSFCHFEKPTAQMLNGIQERGYFIIELKNCQ